MTDDAPGDAPDDDTSPVPSPPSRLGRWLYGGVLAYMAVDGFRNNEKRVEVARERGVPAPELLVPLATAQLLVATLGVLLWRFPRAATAGVIAFFVSTTPAIHNFWTMEGKERHENRINFLKNVALLGGAIVLFDAATDDD